MARISRARHPAGGRFAAEFSFDAFAVAFDFGDPGADDCHIWLLFEEGPIFGELGVAVLELAAEIELSVRVDVRFGIAHAGHGCASGLEVFVVEELRDPGVEARRYRGLADVHGLGVLVLGDGVLFRELAAVVSGAVVPRGLHLATAYPAAHQPRQDVGMPGLLFSDGGALTGREDVLHGFEHVGEDERRMGWLLGPDPGRLIVPSHLGFVAERDVVDIDKYFVASLPVPDLAAGVAGVLEDDANG